MMKVSAREIRSSCFSEYAIVCGLGFRLFLDIHFHHHLPFCQGSGRL
jgi:hypothetical protein